MRVVRPSVVWMVVAVSAVARPTWAQSPSVPVDGVRAEGQRLARDVAVERSESSGLLASALAVGARQWVTERREVARGSTQSTSAAKPFWTRTKLLILGGAVVILGAIVIAKMRETCREQGPACFD